MSNHQGSRWRAGDEVRGCADSQRLDDNILKDLLRRPDDALLRLLARARYEREKDELHSRAASSRVSIKLSSIEQYVHRP